MMSEYNFKQFTTRGSGFRFDGIRVRQSMITITKLMWKRFNEENIKKFSIKFDEQAGAIALKPADYYEDRAYAVLHKGGNSYAIASSLYRVMPMARYYFKEKTDEGFIFIKEKDGK